METSTCIEILLTPKKLSHLCSFHSPKIHEVIEEIFIEGCSRDKPSSFCFRAIVLALLFLKALALDIYTLFLHVSQISTKMTPSLRNLPLPL